MLTVRIPLRTLNPLNHREHWRARSARVKAEREQTFAAFFQFSRFQLGDPVPPVVVTLIREAARAMDTDGLAASFKGVRDEVAKWLTWDDADPRIEWRYAQRKAKGFAVVVEIQPA